MDQETLSSPGPAPVPVNLPAHRQRLAAAVVDLLFVVVVWGTTAIALSAGFGLSVIALVVIGAVVHGYFQGLLTWLTGGQTVGKALFGLALQDADGSPTDQAWSTSLRLVGRYSIGYLLTDVLLLGTSWSLRDPDRRCPHDLLFRTRVVALSDMGELTWDARLRRLDDDRRSGLELIKERWGPLVVLVKWSTAVVTGATGAIVWVGGKAGLLSSVGSAGRDAGSVAGGGGGATTPAAAGVATGGPTAVVVGVTVITGAGFALAGIAGGQQLREPFTLLAAENGQVAVAYGGGESGPDPLVTAPIEADAGPSFGPPVLVGARAMENAGHLAVASSGNFMVGAIGEELVPAAIPSNPSNQNDFGLSPGGETLAVPAGNGVLLQDVASGETRRFDLEEGSSPFDLRFSPDGTQLLMTVTDTTDSSSLVIMDTDSGEITTLESRGFDFGNFHPPTIWSPQSQRVAYIAATVAASPNVLTIIDVATQERTELGIGGLANSPAWSPEGDRIAYSDSTGGPRRPCMVAIDDASITCFDSVLNMHAVHWSWADDLLVGGVPSCGFDGCREEDVGVWAVDPDDGEAFQILRIEAE